MRDSELSEHAYFRDICNNSLLDDEFRQFYRDLQFRPRAVGERIRPEDTSKEHWVYKSPQIPRRQRFRVYYTIEGRTVSIERIGLV